MVTAPGYRKLITHIFVAGDEYIREDATFGVKDSHPNITWILSHAGSFLPYIAWRISLANALKDLSVNIPQGCLLYTSPSPRD